MTNTAARLTSQNHILHSLPPVELDRLLSKIEVVPLELSQVLYEADDPLEHVYFPNSGMVSLISNTEKGQSLEIAVVGSEGMAGLGVFLGVGRSHNRALVQTQGDALRMKAGHLKEECCQGGSLLRTLMRYTQSRIKQVTQTALCNRFHQIEARLCRWLLLTQDRVKTNELPLTQEFLSLMLGVRRSGVTVAAQALQRAALIDYERGLIRIHDREGLEANSCECYRMIKEAFDWLSGPNQKVPST